MRNYRNPASRGIWTMIMITTMTMSRMTMNMAATTIITASNCSAVIDRAYSELFDLESLSRVELLAVSADGIHPSCCGSSILHGMSRDFQLGTHGKIARANTGTL